MKRALAAQDRGRDEGGDDARRAAHVAARPAQLLRLYIEVTQELRHLEEFFQAEQANGRKMLELYELVQCAGSVLPRPAAHSGLGGHREQEAPSKDI